MFIKKKQYNVTLENSKKEIVTITIEATCVRNANLSAKNTIKDLNHEDTDVYVVVNTELLEGE